MIKYKVRVEHRDSWSAENNYTEYKLFDSELEAKIFVDFRMKGREGRSAPEHYESCYYEGVAQ